MKLAIMQPYFFPYIGYFQLMQAVDTFVVYDNIEFSKKGWIQRNRILVNGGDVMISLPLRKDSDYAYIGDRTLADSFPRERNRMLNRITEAYRKAPHFEATMPVIQECLCFEEMNLFRFLLNSLKVLRRHLGIETELVQSSTLTSGPKLKAAERVIAICKELSAAHYINAIGGRELYSKDEFARNGIELSFIQSRPFTYPQFANVFVPNLSIIDVLMFNPLADVQAQLNAWDLV